MKKSNQKNIFLVLIIAALAVGANADKNANVGLVKQAPAIVPKVVRIKLLSEPPVISEEQMRMREEALSKMRHVPLIKQTPVAELSDNERTVVSEEAMARNCDPTPIIIHDDKRLSELPTGADSDFVFFENNEIGTAGAPEDQRSFVNEPSVANNGRCIFYSGNWYASLSVDAGKTFQYINPYTSFGWPAGQDFCCDQVVLYDSGSDCLFWLLQSSSDGDTNNIERLAVANSFSDIENQVWYIYDFSPTNSGAPYGSWFDFPDLSLSKNYLYLTANYIQPDGWGSAAILMLPLDKLKTGAGFSNIYVTEPWPKWVFRAVQGATTSTTMYWAAHNSTNSIRIYHWNENSGFYDWDNVAVAGWDKGTRHAAGPDGKEWLNHFPSRGGYVLGAWMSKGTLGFMWCADEDANHPYPFIRVARFNADDRTLINEPDIWWRDFAWAFPSVNVNGRGDIAGSLMYGGGALYPGCSVFIWDDYTSVPPGWETHASAIGTSGPNEDRFGDYLATRVCYPYSNTWLASAYTLQGGDQDSNAVPRFLWFGRERDRPFYELANDTPVTFSFDKKDFSFKTIGYEWCALAVNPSAAQVVKTDDDFWFDNTYQAILGGANVRNFIVTDGRDFGSATLYATAFLTADTSCSIEAEWQAEDIIVGKQNYDSIGSNEIIQVYEANVSSGNQYEVTVDITNGTVDVSIFGFEASRSSGSRWNPNWYINDNGAGSNESQTFIAESSGRHGIFLINENAKAGGYVLSIDLIPEPFCLSFIIYYLLFINWRKK